MSWARFTVLPAVDVSEGRCVRLLQGRFGTATVYSDDPVEVALGLCSAGARWLHIVDLDAARTGLPRNREIVLEAVRRSSCPVQAGGGLRDIDDVEEMLGAGASRVVLGTMALEDPEELKRICARYGDRIAVSLDVRGDDLQSHGWTLSSGIDVADALKQFEDAGVSSFIYTDVSRDGTMAGPNIDGLVRLSQSTPLPIIASGGIGSLDELRTVASLRSARVIGAVVGRAFYEHKFGVRDANHVADDAALMSQG